MPRTVSTLRSVTKTITYRLLIMSLDFLTIYLFTGAVRIAVEFMIASNIYTTLAYLLHKGFGLGLAGELTALEEAGCVGRPPNLPEFVT